LEPLVVPIVCGRAIYDTTDSFRIRVARRDAVGETLLERSWHFQCCLQHCDFRQISGKRSANMDVFGLHQHVISEYATYTKSFIKIANARVADEVDRQIKAGLLWPYPLIQLNPSFEPGSSIDDLCRENILHQECSRIFRIKDHENDLGRALILHRHQAEATRTARQGLPYVLTTGTGSGKSLCYIIPIVDHVLRNGTGKGIQAIIVYPMNALANSQMEELDKFLKRGYSPV
jgi:ATP-dependent helicase YprA (DUF1998 family)